MRGLADVATISDYSKGIYGTAIATMGMLSSAAYILAMDTFGPITDNAGGIIEMSNQPHSIREKTDKLDAAGNTTKALTKGYAIGSAALAAFLLFSAYLEAIHDIVNQRLAAAGEVLPASWSFSNVNLASVPVFVGALLGAMLTYLFSSMAIKAVGRAAQSVIQDVHQQFKENPGIMEGTSLPDYGRCVHIVTGAALKEMVLPGVLAVAMPLAVGVIFRHFSSISISRNSPILQPFNGVPINLSGAEAVAALLMVGTISGILLAMLMNNGGGAWDNAKKFIETGALRRQAVRGAQSRGCRRHGRRSIQGHCRPVAARAHQTAGHRDAGAGSALRLNRKSAQPEGRLAGGLSLCRWNFSASAMFCGN